MIKFINWFIRPLGYVCVDEYQLNLERLRANQVDLERSFMILNTLNIPSNPPDAHQYMFIGFDYAAEKPEYKDNVVPFNKLV